MRIVATLLIVSFIAKVDGIVTPVVEISQGKVRGLSIGKQNRYHSIPYAQSKRFQVPQEPPKWNGVLNAINRWKPCAQNIGGLIFGSEDCQTLDVYSPRTAAPGDKLPVLVFIHGGAYYYGSKADYDPEFLVIKNIVAVIVNYRVSVLGFLCVDGVANLGLKDQRAALEWVKKNIAAFGGDPDNVTLSGQSAGASAAGMHILSRKSKGLFHKLLLMSGTPISPWAYNLEAAEPILTDARKLARTAKREDVMSVFQNATVSELLNSVRDVSVNTKHFKYTPCVDFKNDPFFHDTPYNNIKSGNFHQVPIMTGYVDVEGLLFFALNDKESLKRFNEDFVQLLPSVFSWCSSEDKRVIAKKLRQHYFGDGVINRSRYRDIINYYSDWIAYSTGNEFSKLMSTYSKAPVYNYMFAYEGGRNFAKALFANGVDIKGATHADDVFYMFKPAGLTIPLLPWDRYFIDRYTSMVANFMKYGNPTPKKTKLLPVKWPRLTKNSSKIMRLGDKFSVIDLSKKNKGEYLLNLLCSHGKAGFVPCESRELCRGQGS